jgi:formylmethanofuran dehydrogenase subunit D
MAEADIYARLLDKLGALPGQDVLDQLTEVARTDRVNLLSHAAPLLKDAPGLAPVLLHLTLGRTLPAGAAPTAVLWAGCHQAARRMTVQVQRALGTELTGPALGEDLFDRVLSSPGGLAFSEHTHDEVWGLMRGERVRLDVPELLEWLAGLDPAHNRPDPEFPLSLIGGQRRSHNANQILRPPAWRRTDADGALRVRAEDLAAVGAAEGDWVAVVSRTGRIVARAETDGTLRAGQLALPHGYGMSVPDGQGGRVVDGPRINLLTDAADRDPIAGTPHHKDVPVRLEPATTEERDAAQRDSDRVRRLVTG